MKLDELNELDELDENVGAFLGVRFLVISDVVSDVLSGIVSGVVAVSAVVALSFGGMPKASAAEILSVSSPASSMNLPSQADCSVICRSLKSSLKAHARELVLENERWQRRLGLKSDSDIVRYDEGFSAAEELLKFMAGHHRMQAPGHQGDPRFLALLMATCFPEAQVDQVHARMSKLVDILWVARNMKIENKIFSCSKGSMNLPAPGSTSVSTSTPTTPTTPSGVPTAAPSATHPLVPNPTAAPSSGASSSSVQPVGSPALGPALRQNIQAEPEF